MNHTTEFFDEQAESWAGLYSTDTSFERRYALMTRLITGTIGEREPARALDLGCGGGVFSAHLVELGWRVLAVDASPAMLQAAESHCRTRLGGRIDAIEFREMRIEDLDLGHEGFDLVLCLSALEYVENDQAAVTSMADALRPGGVLVLTVPNRWSFVRLVERFIDRVRPRGSYLRLQRHQYVPSEIDTALLRLSLWKDRDVFFSVGFTRPRAIAVLLERPWFAGMYGAAYVKHAGTG